MNQPQSLLLTSPKAEESLKRRATRIAHPAYGALGFGLLLLLTLLAACSGIRPSTVEEEDPLAALGAMPHYEIEFSLSDDLIFLQGSARVRVPNTSDDPWTHLVFRLYPALPHYGGEFSIQNVTVEGSTAPFVYLEQNTAIRVDLPRALLRGQTTNVYLSWQLRVPHWGADTTGAYRLFGLSQEFLSLPLFYPSLAVYLPGPTAASGRWWLERGTSRGDAAFNYISQFVVTGTLPIDQIPVASGQLITSTVVGDQHIQHRWETELSREFFVHMSNRFQSDSLDAYGTRVTSYWLPEHEEAGRAVLQHTAAALRVYSDWFGPIPTRSCAWPPRRSASGGWNTRRSSCWACNCMTATGTNWRSGRSTKSRTSGGTSLSTTIRSTSPGLMKGWPNTPAASTMKRCTARTQPTFWNTAAGRRSLTG